MAAISSAYPDRAGVVREWRVDEASYVKTVIISKADFPGSVKAIHVRLARDHIDCTANDIPPEKCPLRPLQHFNSFQIKCVECDSWRTPDINIIEIGRASCRERV